MYLYETLLHESFILVYTNNSPKIDFLTRSVMLTKYVLDLFVYNVNWNIMYLILKIERNDTGFFI